MNCSVCVDVNYGLVQYEVINGVGCQITNKNSLLLMTGTTSERTKHEKMGQEVKSSRVDALGILEVLP
jgi:hypothetical protein